jgi:pimeloyl-ACP methyl ester carboxylesterase
MSEACLAWKDLGTATISDALDRLGIPGQCLGIKPLEGVTNHELTLFYKGKRFQTGYFERPGGNGTLLYLHGLGCSRRDFLPAANVSSLRDYRLVAFDFPGCGKANYDEQLTLEATDLVEIVSKVATKLDLTKFVLVGHSLGGLVGLMFASKYQGRVERFVNIEGNLTAEDCFMTRAIARRSFDDFRRSRHLEELKETFARSEYPGSRIFAAESLLQVSQRAFYDYSKSVVAHSDRGDLLPCFLGLNIPRLFIYGSANGHLSYLPKLRSNGGCVVEVPGSGHWPMYDNPSFFYAALATFLGCR